MNQQGKSDQRSHKPATRCDPPGESRPYSSLAAFRARSACDGDHNDRAKKRRAALDCSGVLQGRRRLHYQRRWEELQPPAKTVAAIAGREIPVFILTRAVFQDAA
jgi:hypothetical protein